jgi:hypothetical protein
MAARRSASRFDFRRLARQRQHPVGSGFGRDIRQATLTNKPSGRSAGGRQAKIRDEEWQGMSQAAKRCHQSADRATHPGIAAPGKRRVACITPSLAHVSIAPAKNMECGSALPIQINVYVVRPRAVVCLRKTSRRAKERMARHFQARAVPHQPYDLASILRHLHHDRKAYDRCAEP